MSGGASFAQQLPTLEFCRPESRTTAECTLRSSSCWVRHQKQTPLSALHYHPKAGDAQLTKALKSPFSQAGFVASPVSFGRCVPKAREEALEAAAETMRKATEAR